MKRILASLATIALVAPGAAMAGGIEGGVKNSYFTNFNTETINFGQRDIQVDSYSEISWEGETESHKSFVDKMGKLTGVEGDYSYDSGDNGCKPCYPDGPSKEFNLSFEDPKAQFTFSEGWTNTYLKAEGYETTDTSVTIYEEYEGYSESTEHGHEATNFASVF